MFPEPVGVHYTGPTMTILRAQLKTADISVLDGKPVAVGDRLVVERGGLVIGELEVVLIGEHSATCRIDRELRPVTEGDVVRPLGTPAAPPTPTPPASALAPATPEPPAVPAPPTTPAPATPEPPTAAVPPPPQPGQAPETVPGVPSAPAAPPTPAPVPAEPEKTGPILVRQVLAQEVFLDAGRAAGLVVGQRAKIVHAGTEIAEVEIAFLANHSASCKIVSSTATIEIGDLVVPGPAPVSAEPPPGSVPYGAGKPAAGAKGPGGKPPGWVAAEHTDYSGSIAMRYQGFRDGSPSGRDFNQESALFNIYLGHINGSHYDVRLRGTSSREQIHLASGASENRDNDRLYEATLTYEPPGVRFTYQVGRLISGPLVGFDYLDGGVGEFHATRRFSLGAFYGTRSNSDQLTFKSPGRAYGAFAHWLDQTIGNPFYAEYLFEAIGDYIGGQTNREYLSFYGRQGSGSRWSLYERAELDLNRAWRRQNSNGAYQLTNVLFSGSYSVVKWVRLGLSYDQSRQILTLDDRFTPEELFDNSLREGARISAYLGSGQSLRGNLSVGERWKQGSPERSRTYNANVYHSNVFHLNLLVGADYSGFDGDTSKGYRAGFRVQKYFKSGHDLEITIGTSTTEIAATREQRKNQWARLSGTLQLGRRLYLLGEFEKATGDDLAGDRLFLQLGYRL